MPERKSGARARRRRGSPSPSGSVLRGSPRPAATVSRCPGGLTHLIVSVNLPFVATYQGGAVLEALGDPTRRAIFEMLGEGPHAVGQLAGRLPVSQPAVSQHLKV